MTIVQHCLCCRATEPPQCGAHMVQKPLMTRAPCIAAHQADMIAGWFGRQGAHWSRLPHQPGPFQGALEPPDGPAASARWSQPEAQVSVAAWHTQDQRASRSAQHLTEQRRGVGACGDTHCGMLARNTNCERTMSPVLGSNSSWCCRSSKHTPNTHASLRQPGMDRGEGRGGGWRGGEGRGGVDRQRGTASGPQV